METVGFRLRVFLVALLAVITLGTLGFMAVEDLSPVDALYFSIVTIATVGYGDIHPATPLGKVLAIILIVTGVGTFLGVIANATELLLNRRENQFRLQKLHMVMGLFFSEVGTELLARFTDFDPNLENLRNDLIITGGWSDEDFLHVSKRLGNYNFTIDTRRHGLGSLRSFLMEKGGHLLRLLESPYLLEHESFTELLRAIFHLRAELINRGDLGHLPETDHAHLAGDMKRAYTLLVRQWLIYMQYLKEHYPYLFSLAMRTNPFDREASPVVE